MDDDVRFNDVQLMLIREALESLWLPENPRDPAGYSVMSKAERIRILRKISKLLDHPKTEFV